MGFIKRLFGISVTPSPADSSCWEVKDGQILLDLTKAPQLKNPGGAIRLENKGLDKRVLVFCDEQGQLHAMHNKCACAGWRLDPHVSSSTVQCCTLGMSTYSYDGQVISGSAKEPVQVFEVEREDNTVVINLA